MRIALASFCLLAWDEGVTERSSPMPPLQEKIASYEAAFREIKEATGVADVNEVIQKFITQEETHKNLQAM